MSYKSPYKKGGLFEGASHLLFENAKKLRNNLTASEELLWMYLRKGINGYKFRRQHSLNNYIVDFFCFKAKLVIEIDGSVHNRTDVIENDLIRQKDLENLGYKVIRFSNFEIHNNIDKIIDIISEKINNIINSNTPVNGV